MTQDAEITLDPAIRSFLDATPQRPLDYLDTARKRHLARLVSDATFLQFGEQPPEVAHKTFETDDAPVRLRVYWPDGARRGRPIHVLMHGGGWWLGSIDELVVDATCRERASAAGHVVVAVDYRLAPEHKFPAAVEDGAAALAWIAEHAVELGGDPARISLGGASAGGNLAAALALRTHLADGPRLTFQLLEVPAVDLTRFHDQGDGAGLTGVGLDHDELSECVAYYLADPEQARDPLASPLLAEDLAGLPPAHIMTAEFDPIRDQGEAYAKRLSDTGVLATSTRYAGAIHGSIGLTRTYGGARLWRREVIQTLRRLTPEA